MAKQILIMRGPEDRLPSKLAEGELAFCLDSKKLFIAGSAENVLLADGNGGGDSSAAYVYKCTGTDDNVVICQIVESFLSTNDSVKKLKLYIEGVVGINQTAFGVGSASNPYKVFYENGDNPYGKTIVLDGTNCTFPKAEYSGQTSLSAHYFNMKNVGLENISIEIECTALGSGNGYGFYGCSNLTNCTGTGTAPDNGNGDGEGQGYGFYDCSNLTNCIGTGSGTGSGYASGYDYSHGIGYGYGFCKCNNLTNCTGTGIGIGIGYSKDYAEVHGRSSGYGFYGCSNLTNCTGTGTGTGTGSDNGNGNGEGNGCGFYDCSNLANCTGTGTGYAYSDSYEGYFGEGFGYGYGFCNCSNLTNCTGTGTGTGVGIDTDAEEGTGHGYGFYDCSNLTNCTGTGTGIGIGYGFGQGYGFYGCGNLTNCTGTGIGIVEGYGFYNCKRLESCKGYGYRENAGTGKGSGFYWSSSTSNVAQMLNCTAPRKSKSGYTQDYGTLLEGTTDGAKYCLIGNTIAPDSGGFVGIKKHTKTGSEYTETGTIRASVE